MNGCTVVVVLDINLGHAGNLTRSFAIYFSAGFLASGCRLHYICRFENITHTSNCSLLALSEGWRVIFIAYGLVLNFNLKCSKTVSSNRLHACLTRSDGSRTQCLSVQVCNSWRQGMLSSNVVPYIFAHWWNKIELDTWYGINWNGKYRCFKLVWLCIRT